MRKSLCRQEVYSAIIQTHRARIHGRLRSTKWVTPPFFRGKRKASLPLETALQQLCSADSTSRLPKVDRKLKDALSQIAALMKAYDNISDPTQEVRSLQELSECCFHVCTSDGTSVLEETLSRNGFKGVATDPSLRQLEKIGNCYRIARDMVSATRKYPQMFFNVSCQYVEPFRAVNSPISSSGRQVSCHVHAEVQLIVSNDIHSQGYQSVSQKPRAIGTSKATSFLCALFMRKHGQYHFSQEHAKLYDQWTIPDLEEYSQSTILRYRNIIESMNRDLLKLSNVRHPWRPFPQTSWQDFRRLPFTPEDSSHSTSVATIENSPLINEKYVNVGPVASSTFKHSMLLESTAPSGVTNQSKTVLKGLENSKSIDPELEDRTSITVDATCLTKFASPNFPLQGLSTSGSFTEALVDQPSCQHFHLRAGSVECFIEADLQTEVSLKCIQGEGLFVDNDKQVWEIDLDDLASQKVQVWTSPNPYDELRILMKNNGDMSAANTGFNAWLLILKSPVLHLGHSK